MIRLAVGMLCFWLLSSCGGNPVNQYPTWQEAEASGAIDKGWIPEFVPVNATDIYEQHDVDADHLRVEFSVPSNDYRKLINSAEFELVNDSLTADLVQRVHLPSWSKLNLHETVNVWVRCSNSIDGIALTNSSHDRVHYIEPAPPMEACLSTRDDPDQSAGSVVKE